MVLLAAGISGSCGFEINGAMTDASGVDADAPIDVPPPDMPAVPASCAAIHMATPLLASGTYMIDPDGAGPDAPFSVTCDMITDGGGWTVVFFPQTTNLSAAAAYTSSSPRLLADAQKVLIAFRDEAQVTVGSFASFDMPSAWRTETPFNMAGTDLPTSVSVNGAAPTTAMVRYGSSNFGNRCQDAWNTSSSLGRVCVMNTGAPYFNSFRTGLNDNCGDSYGNWNSMPCSMGRRFSIAVR